MFVSDDVCCIIGDKFVGTVFVGEGVGVVVNPPTGAVIGPVYCMGTKGLGRYVGVATNPPGGGAIVGEGVGAGAGTNLPFIST